MNTNDTQPDGRGDPSRQAPQQPVYGGNLHYNLPYYHGGGGEETGLLGSVDIFRLLRVFRRKWLTILLALTFFAGGAWFYLQKTPKAYLASSLLELSVRRPRIVAQQGAVLDDPSAGYQSEEVFNTRLEKMKGKDMFDTALAKYLAKRSDKIVVDEDFKKRFEKNVKFTLLRRTRLIKIEFEDTDPGSAADACNAYAEAAEDCAFEENKASSDSAVAWLQSQAQTKRKEIEKADDDLLKFRENNKIDVLESQRKTVEEAMLAFNKNLVEIESDESKVNELYNTLNAGKLPSDIPHALEIKEASTKWHEAIAERNALLAKYTAKHPEVEGKEKVIKLYESQVKLAIQHAQYAVGANLKLLGDQAESLRKKKAEQSQIASDLELKITDRKMKQAALQRERDASEMSYRGILNRMEEARLAADERTATAKLVEKAMIPKRPFKPRPLLIMFMGIMVGMVAGMGLALVVDTLEDHVTGPQDVEMTIGLKVFSTIPHIKGKERVNIAKAALDQKFSQFAEAFAGLRTMLDSPQYKEHTKVVLISSSVPAEGKTITTCNLAITCARNGQNVLLIDFDMRRPRLMNIFPFSPENKGLLNFLVTEPNERDFEKLVSQTECPNLSIIGSRPVKDVNPAESIGGKQVEALLLWARQRYDRVILDAPPLGIVSDATVLGGMADCVLIMSRPNVSRKRAIGYTVQRFREMGVPLIAGVVNDMDFESASYHSPHYYYHNYKSYGQEADKV